MKGLILVITLILISCESSIGQVLDPKWLKIMSMSDQTVFMDTTNIKKVDYQITVVSLTQFNTPKYIAIYKKEASSVKSQILFNLTSRKYVILGSLYYDNQLKIVGENSLPGFSIGNEAFAVHIDSNKAMKAMYEKSISILNIDTSKYSAQESANKEFKLRALIDNSGPMINSGQNIQQPNQKENVTSNSETANDNTYKEPDKKTESAKPNVVTKSNYSSDYDNRNEKNIRSTIFSDGNKFCLQVSSWKLQRQAESEVSRLKRKGENAFIVEANIPSKGGRWYRVRIGYFNSLEETENYMRNRK